MTQDESPEEVRADLPDPVPDFSVRAEQRDGAWAVVKTVDGQESVIETFADEQPARMMADTVGGAATRHKDAARAEPVPEGYPDAG